MIKNIPSRKFTVLKVAAYSALLCSVLASGTMSVMKAQAAEEERSEMIPISTIAPKYPKSALQEKLEGWALVKFTVSKKGEVLNPEIVSSCTNFKALPGREDSLKSNVNDCPDNTVFDSPSLTALKGFKFEPEIGR